MRSHTENGSGADSFRKRNRGDSLLASPLVVPNRNAFKIERFRNMMDARKRVASRGLHVSNHTFFASDQRMGQWARLRLHGNLENTPEVEASFPSGT